MVKIVVEVCPVAVVSVIGPEPVEVALEDVLELVNDNVLEKEEV